MPLSLQSVYKQTNVQAPVYVAFFVPSLAFSDHICCSSLGVIQVNPTGAYELLFHIILYLREPLIGKRRFSVQY